MERMCFSRPWTRKMICDTAANECCVFLVAIAAGCVVGYGSADLVAGTAYFNNVAVGSEYRRHGVGEALVQELCERARRLACTEATLEVREQNLPAVALYKKCGFVPVGRRPGYYSEPPDDALIMTRVL